MTKFKLQLRYFVIVYYFKTGQDSDFGNMAISSFEYPSRKDLIRKAKCKCVIVNVQELSKKDFDNWIK